MLRPLRLIGLLCLLLPLSTSAMWSTAWDFRNGQIPGSWESSGIVSAQASAQGLHVRATDNSAVYRAVRFDHRVDTLHLVATTPIDVEMKFLWEQEDGSGMVELPFTLLAADAERGADVELSKYPQWTNDTKTVGLAFPPGGDVVIQRMDFRGWNTIERLEEALLSTWQFDTHRAYSINFLWGPRIAYNSVGRTQMFAFLPPFATSVNRILYPLIALIALAALGANVLRMSSERRRKAFVFLVGSIAALWILYDMRMTAEILSYVQSDLHDYVLKDTPRDRDSDVIPDFWDAVKKARPALEREQAVVFATIPGAPLLSFLRYALYPVAVLAPGDDHPSQALWFVYGRSNASIDDQGRLVLGTEIASKPGALTQTIANGSFLFRER